MRERRIVLMSVLSALLAWGCGRESSRPSPSPPPPAVAAPSPTPAATARTVDVCASAPDAEVARALGAKVRKPARSSQTIGSECDYDLDFGDGHSSFFFVWAGPPSVYFSREMVSGKADAVSGLGQDAFIEHALPENMWDLHVLISPDLAVEAKGDQREQVLALARFLVTRLQGGAAPPGQEAH
jgi:hypothetical protein